MPQFVTTKNIDTIIHPKNSFFIPSS